MTDAPDHYDTSPAAQPDEMSDGERIVDAMLAEAHLLAPHELPELVRRHAAVLGASDARMYLVDVQQVMLVPFLGSAGPGRDEQREPLAVDSTLAGRAFQQIDVLSQPADAGGNGTRVWLPLLNGTERVGVLAVTLTESKAIDDANSLLGRRLRRFATLVAELIMTKEAYGDAIVRTRRRGEMGLAAEICHLLLPPLTFASRAVSIAGALEPAMAVAGDVVDYAVDEGRTHLGIFDGMGHGLHSAMLATVTVAAYRNARRADRSLTDTARAIDAAVAAGSVDDAFSTGIIAELDTDTGVLTWVNAGHPEPLLIRDGGLVKALHTEPAVPFGLGVALSGMAGFTVGSESLQPGDHVAFFTDGVIEARSPEGEQFGVDRLVDLIVRSLAGGLPAPETMRRLVRAILAHQEGQLDDDATLLLVEYDAGPPRLP